MDERDLDLYEHTDTVNELLARYGVKFGIYKNNTFKEQLFPFDAIPRVIGHDEFAELEKGLKQRVMALNLFIKDIYGEKKILRDKVVPEEFVYAGSGYLAQCEGVMPSKGIYSHILISLCHMEKIPARYVVGMLEGEGLSHAWVEIYENGMWIGLDPTNDLVVGEQHIKVSSGRDYGDCTINQGIFTGAASQTQTASVVVEVLK